MMTLVSSVSEASSILMTLESSFTIIIGLKYRPQVWLDRGEGANDKHTSLSLKSVKKKKVL
jgi:hypothetical protein